MSRPPLEKSLEAYRLYRDTLAYDVAETVRSELYDYDEIDADEQARIVFDYVEDQTTAFQREVLRGALVILKKNP